MISRAYSDPFLKQLSEINPKEAAEYFKLISESKFKDDLAACLETPQEILVQIGVQACGNPNFPQSELERFLNEEEILHNSFWIIFKSPDLTEKNISQLMRCSNPNVRGLALAHEYGDAKELLIFLKGAFEAGLQGFSVAEEICRNRKLTDEVFQFLLSVHEVQPSSRGSVGAELWSNPFLTPEQRAALILYSVEEPEIKPADYWGGIPTFYASTLAFFPHFKCSDYYKKVESLNRIPESYVRTFTELGHPLGLLLADENEGEPLLNTKALNEMISEYNLLHRLFWPELCERDDFEIYRRNAYRTDDLFISHPILGREFEEVDDPSEAKATQLGGVFTFSDSYTWLLGDEELPLDMAIWEFLHNSRTLVDTVETFSDGFENLGLKLAALTFSYPGLADKYGFKLNENAAFDVVDTAISLAEPDSFDVSAEINSDFPEMLSWRNLPETNKRGIFELLKIGSTLPESKATSDSIHFLGCMALHGDTPESLLNELSSLGIPIVDEVLASRDMG